MKLSILGSGVGLPSTNRGAPGYYLNINNENILIDSGSGTLSKIAKAGLNFFEINKVFYTHFHIDHIADFFPILFALRLHASIYNENKKLFLYGAVGFKELFEKLKDVYKDQIVSEKFNIILNELKDRDQIKEKDFKVSSFKLLHTPKSLGYRFEDNNGKVIVFSGDTGNCDALVELSKDADLAVFECSVPEEYEVSDHLNPSLAGKLAQKAGVKKLILSHLYPITDSFPIVERCKKFFEGPIFLAEDLQSFDI